MVDFEALGADGLFLLHGQTGAGKTTVLDAVAFALFGKVPGARGQVKKLRSDHSAPDARPQVSLEFTVQGRRIRIVRSPEYERLKRRGSGTTKENARVSLTWCDEPESEGLTRIDEVARTVERLVGMTAEQFFQVALLPQGEFARFLRAETDEREKLLERLFATSRFADVESWFRERRTASTQSLRIRTESVSRLVARFCQAAGAVEPPEGDAEADWAREIVGQLRTAVTQAEEASVAASATAAIAEAEHSAIRAREQLVSRRRRADEALAEVRAMRQEREGRRLRCERAQRAEPAHAAWQAAERAQKAAAERNAEAFALKSALTAVLDDSVPEDPLELGVLARQWREENGRLTELLEVSESLKSDELAVADARQQQEATEIRLAELQALSGVLPERLRSAEQAVAVGLEASAALPGLLAVQERRLHELEAAVALTPAIAEEAQLQSKAAEARETLLVAKEQWLELREARLAGMAAELAVSLVEGDPCPVCGSAVHPELAVSANQVDPHSEEQAQLQVKEAEQHYAEVAEDLASAAQLVATLRIRSAGGEVGDLEAAKTKADAAVRHCQDLAAGREAQETALSELRSAAESFAVEESQLRSRRAEHEEGIRVRQAAIEERRSRIDAARGSESDLDSRRERLQLAVEAIEELLASINAGKEASRYRDLRRSEVEEMASAAGFTTVDEMLAASLGPAELAEITELVRVDADTEAAAVAAAADPDLRGIDPDESVDIAAAEAAKLLVLEISRSAEIAFAAARRRSREAEELFVELAAAWEELEPVRQHHRELAALTEVVNGQGQNFRRMSLRSYVLAARLEEVAVVASRRLGRMSSGRFAFAHSDAGGRFGTRGGLGLDMVDDFTGTVRPANTLSGGESFLASLALALGLADVVAAESGGILLDTLFVDEGFGSLDTETLDLVMDTLDELRAGGRVVGLVSHVEELKQRIPHRLKVVHGKHGSTLQMEVHAAAAISASAVAVSRRGSRSKSGRTGISLAS
jgi:exonuclease SbcC